MILVIIIGIQYTFKNIILFNSTCGQLVYSFILLSLSVGHKFLSWFDRVGVLPKKLNVVIVAIFSESIDSIVVQNLLDNFSVEIFFITCLCFYFYFIWFFVFIYLTHLLRIRLQHFSFSFCVNSTVYLSIAYCCHDRIFLRLYSHILFNFKCCL